MIHSFFSSFKKFEYLSIFSFSFLFIQRSAGTAKSTRWFFFYYYVTPGEFFPLALADGPSRESEWQKVLSGFHQPCEYSSQPYQCSGLNRIARSVTYWPSTELSIKRFTCVNNRCIWWKISGYNLDLWTGWIRCTCNAHRKQVDIKQLYNQVPQTAWVSWSSSSSRSWGQDAVERTNARQRAWALRTPVEQPSRIRKKCCYSQRNLGSIFGSLFRLQLTSHTWQILTLLQPYRNPFDDKVLEVYFSKEVCSFVIIVDYVSACMCIRIVVSWLYNTSFDFHFIRPSFQTFRNCSKCTSYTWHHCNRIFHIILVLG